MAVTATPWPGLVAVHASESDENYALSDLVAARATIGRTLAPLHRARPGLWDEGAPLAVRLFSGMLESRSRSAILNGANLVAIGDGSPGRWELFQFRDAELVERGTWALSGRLRGQLGSEALMPDTWPAESWVVLIDEAVQQISLSSAQRGALRHYRIGPAARGYDDPLHTHVVERFDGNGLRPYAPCHLRLQRLADGALRIRWIRRTRSDGDGWDGLEVPLGEEQERYLIRLHRGETLLRSTTVDAPAWTYTAADQARDDADAATVIEVAQVSARYGPGPSLRAFLPV